MRKVAIISSIGAAIVVMVGIFGASAPAFGKTLSADANTARQQTGVNLPAVSFTANLTASNVVPPSDPVISASALFKYDPASQSLDYNVSVKGVSATAAVDIHHGPSGANGPVLHSLDTSGATIVSGNVKLTDSDVEDLYAGNLYIEADTNLPGQGLIAARAQLELPGTAPVAMPVVTSDSYLFELAVNPPEKMIMPNMAAGATSGELMVMVPGLPVPPMSMTDQGMPVDHHVEIHIFDLKTGAVVKDKVPTMLITNEATGATRTLASGNIMAMYGLDIGTSDFHFGNNMYLPDGTYMISVTLGGQTAVFHHVAIKAAAMSGMASITPPSTGDAGLASSKYR